MDYSSWSADQLVDKLISTERLAAVVGYQASLMPNPTNWADLLQKEALLEAEAKELRLELGRRLDAARST